MFKLFIGQHLSTATTSSFYKTADGYIREMPPKLVLSHALMLDFY